MGKLFKFLLGVLVLAGALYVCYLGYTKWYLTGGLSKAANTVQQSGSAALQNAKQSIVADAEAVIKKNAGDIIKYLGNQISSAGENLAGETSTPAASSSAPAASTTSMPAASSTSFYNNQVIPVSSSTPGSFATPPPAVSILTHVNTAVYFSLVADGAYEVKWGDGTVDDGTGDGANKVTVVSHIWKTPGDYTIAVSASLSGTNNSYSFPIRVLE